MKITYSLPAQGLDLNGKIAIIFEPGKRVQITGGATHETVREIYEGLSDAWQDVIVRAFEEHASEDDGEEA